MLPVRHLALSITRNLRNNLKRALTSKCAPELTENDASIADQSILVSQSGPITLIGINRPAKKNCLDSSSAELLSNALDAFETNDESEIAIIHGIGGNFCSGFDLDEMATANEDNFPHFSTLCSRKPLIKKPLIASITGYAVGVGFELALMCDLRVVEEPARMAFLNRRLGIPIMCGGTVRLPAMVGYSRANELILTGRELTADEAFSWGIANRLVACGAALGQSVSLAQSILKYPQGALLADRASLHTATFEGKGIDEALEIERDISTDILMEQGVKGAQKFVDGFGRHGKSANITQCDRTSFKELKDDLL